MKTTKIQLSFLPLLLPVLACTLTAKPIPPPQAGAAMVAQGANPTQAQTFPSPAPTPTKAPQVCKVSTGLSEGRLNLRACGGMECAIVAVLRDGEVLTVIEAGDWAQVQTMSGLIGYINSAFCKAGK